MKKYNYFFALFAVFALALGMCACVKNDAPPEDTQLILPGAFEETEKVTYTVKVIDEAGKPVENCAIQLCLDVCIPGFTNEDGMAEISAAEAAYKVSVTFAPDGYSFDPDAVYFFENGTYEMTITLKAA